jgi:hypothetical protein
MASQEFAPISIGLLRQAAASPELGIASATVLMINGQVLASCAPPKQKAKTISITLLVVFAFFAYFYFNDFELTMTSSIKPYSFACWAVM